MLGLVRDKKYFVLHAPRQTGKTSALLALRDLLNGGAAGDYRCVYANVEAGQAMRENVGGRPAHGARPVGVSGQRDAARRNPGEPLAGPAGGASGRGRRCTRRWRAGAWRTRARWCC